MTFMLKFDRRKCLARSERGQSLVEMTIGLIILLIIASGLLDLGRAYFTYVALEDGAGEAALYIAVNPDCLQDNADPSDGVCDDPSNAMWRAENAGGAFVDWSSATVNFNPAPPYSEGDAVEVTIAYPYELLTPVIPDIAGANSLTLTAHAVQTIVAK
jgi:Flp pilus assembly protein TadG